MQPWSLAATYCMLGKGYLSGVVAKLRLRYSPHGPQLQSFFLTMWSGEAQGLFERGMMPAATSSWNSVLAHCSFFGSNLPALAKRGGR